jgi:hypothetical protein
VTTYGLDSAFSYESVLDLSQAGFRQLRPTNLILNPSREGHPPLLKEETFGTVLLFYSVQYVPRPMLQEKNILARKALLWCGPFPMFG